MKFLGLSVLQQSCKRDGGRSSDVGDVDTGVKPNNGAQVKSLGIERLLKPELDSGEVSVLEMNESEPLLSSVEKELDDEESAHLSPGCYKLIESPQTWIGLIRRRDGMNGTWALLWNCRNLRCRC